MEQTLYHKINWVDNQMLINGKLLVWYYTDGGNIEHMII